MPTTINLHEPPPRSDAKAFLNYQIAVMQAYAEGKPVEFRGTYAHAVWSTDHVPPYWSWNNVDYRITPPKIAAGHNPHELTEEQVGVGFRCLSEAERAYRETLAKSKDGVPTHPDIEMWDKTAFLWNISPAQGYLRQATYRTNKPPGFFLTKPKTTIREWLQELPEGYRERAIKNHEDYIAKHPSYMGHTRQYTHADQALVSAFCYERAPEGLVFWGGVQAAISGVTPTPALPPLPKEKKLMPWTFDTCPKTGFFRAKEDQVKAVLIGVYFAPEYINLHSHGYVSYHRLLTKFEFSTDAKNWQPCGTLE